MIDIHIGRKFYPRREGPSVQLKAGPHTYDGLSSLLRRIAVHFQTRVVHRLISGSTVCFPLMRRCTSYCFTRALWLASVGGLSSVMGKSRTRQPVDCQLRADAGAFNTILGPRPIDWKPGNASSAPR
jgi:hypothetical protein